MVKLTLSSTSTDFTVNLFPPIKLDSSKTYECAFLSLYTYNSLPNITEENNTFRYSPDKGLTWKNVQLPTGAYEMTDINWSIKRQMLLNEDYNKKESNKFYIDIDHWKPTFQSILNVSNDDYVFV